MIIFLDDNPIRTKEFARKIPHAQTATTAQETIKFIENSDEQIELLFLDHDLGGQEFVDSSREDTGMEVVRYIEANHPAIDKIVIHSLNTPAALEMKSRLAKMKYDVDYIPFYSLIGRISAV